MARVLDVQKGKKRWFCIYSRLSTLYRQINAQGFHQREFLREQGPYLSTHSKIWVPRSKIVVQQGLYSSPEICWAHKSFPHTLFTLAHVQAPILLLAPLVPLRSHGIEPSTEQAHYSASLHHVGVASTVRLVASTATLLSGKPLPMDVPATPFRWWWI